MGVSESISAVRDGLALAFHTESGQVSEEAQVVAQLRVPRTLLGLLAGSALGTAGALLQGHTRNPLADTNLLGIAPGRRLRWLRQPPCSAHYRCWSRWGSVSSARQWR
ncbi:iron ABC transporter permease [Corynebacterium sp. c8Ua_144]|uniref:Iron ABC transporter permease n=1 Tax=Corynebacterium lehmanniae TaxID=2913497 RepID=A0ABT4R6K6_9CORY|nr:iron chelate uptake ABC transporter family permease subunit [Corynebacterium lehmanniae]MCZ9291190.1 iron ABC transporter permease [Corynebacterium lehmanniae]